jgi:hypothetical protein
MHDITALADFDVAAPVPAYPLQSQSLIAAQPFERS